MALINPQCSTTPLGRRDCCLQRRSQTSLCGGWGGWSTAINSRQACRSGGLRDVARALQPEADCLACPRQPWLLLLHRASSLRRPIHSGQLYSTANVLALFSPEQRGTVRYRGGPHVREEAGVCSARHARHTAVRAGHHLMTRKPSGCLSRWSRSHYKTVPICHNAARLHVCCDAGTQAFRLANSLLPASSRDAVRSREHKARPPPKQGHRHTSLLHQAGIRGAAIPRTLAS